jgi:hypothetical protein
MSGQVLAAYFFSAFGRWFSYVWLIGAGYLFFCLRSGALGDDFEGADGSPRNPPGAASLIAATAATSVLLPALIVLPFVASDPPQFAHGQCLYIDLLVYTRLSLPTVSAYI